MDRSGKKRRINGGQRGLQEKSSKGGKRNFFYHYTRRLHKIHDNLFLREGRRREVITLGNNGDNFLCYGLCRNNRNSDFSRYQKFRMQTRRRRELAKEVFFSKSEQRSWVLYVCMNAELHTS